MPTSLEPRDAGYAAAALALDGERAPGAAASAPRGAGPRIEAALRDLIAKTGGQGPATGGGLEGARAALAAIVEFHRRAGPGATLAEIHPSWLVEALADESDETIEAVIHCLPEAAKRGTLTGLAQAGRALCPPPRPGGIRAEVEMLAAGRFLARTFPHAGGSGDPLAEAAAEQRWLRSAPPAEIERVARELGIRAVARAFSGISREDLAKLCHGLPPGDSVRLVSAVVELGEATKGDEGGDKLRRMQRVYLKLLRAGGVSPALFMDTGLAFLAEALLAKLPDRARHALAYRLPEPLGRRLLDLSAPGAILDEGTREAFARDLPVWLKELEAKGTAQAYGSAGTGAGTESGA